MSVATLDVRETSDRLRSALSSGKIRDAAFAGTLGARLDRIDKFCGDADVRIPRNRASVGSDKDTEASAWMHTWGWPF